MVCLPMLSSPRISAQYAMKASRLPVSLGVKAAIWVASGSSCCSTKMVEVICHHLPQDHVIWHRHTLQFHFARRSIVIARALIGHQAPSTAIGHDEGGESECPSLRAWPRGRACLLDIYRTLP